MKLLPQVEEGVFCWLVVNPFEGGLFKCLHWVFIKSLKKLRWIVKIYFKLEFQLLGVNELFNVRVPLPFYFADERL